MAELVCISLYPKNEGGEDWDSKDRKSKKSRSKSPRRKLSRASPVNASQETSESSPWYFAASEISCSLSVVHQYKRAEFCVVDVESKYDEKLPVNFVAPSRVSAASGPNRPLSARMRPQSGRRRSVGGAV